MRQGWELHQEGMAAQHMMRTKAWVSTKTDTQEMSHLMSMSETLILILKLVLLKQD